MILFQASRQAARALTIGAFVDLGPEAPKGQRYGRKIKALSGSSSQRRKTLRALKREAATN